MLSKRTDLSCPSFYQLWCASSLAGHSAASSAKAGHWVKSSEVVGIVLNSAMRPRINQCFFHSPLPVAFSLFHSPSSPPLPFLPLPVSLFLIFLTSVVVWEVQMLLIPVTLEPAQKGLGSTVTRSVRSLGTRKNPPSCSSATKELYVYVAAATAAAVAVSPLLLLAVATVAAVANWSLLFLFLWGNLLFECNAGAWTPNRQPRVAGEKLSEKPVVLNRWRQIWYVRK